MTEEASGTFQDILDEWVEKNAFIGNKYDETDIEDYVHGAELDGIQLFGPLEQKIKLIGASMARVRLVKNFDLGKYPFDESDI